MAIAEAIILIRTNSQGARRCFRENDLTSHIHSSLQKFLHAYPHFHITIDWVPGHQGLGGNSRTHEPSRAKFTPGSSTLWPEPYDPRAHRRQMHKERTALMLDLGESTITLRCRSHRYSRFDTALIRRARTQSLGTPLHSPYSGTFRSTHLATLPRLFH